MADDAHQHRRVQALRELLEHRPQFGLERGGVEIERQVAGNIHLELIVGGALDFDAGARGGALHGRALVFHALAPQIAGDRADRAADQRTGAGTSACGRADHGAGHSPDAGAGGGALLPFAQAVVGCTARHREGCQDGHRQAPRRARGTRHEWGIRHNALLVWTRGGQHRSGSADPRAPLPF
jgi:hypothetical protein